MPGIRLALKTQMYPDFLTMIPGQELNGAFTAKVLQNNGTEVEIELLTLSASKSKKMSTQEVLFSGIKSRLDDIDESIGKQGITAV